jgi:hypothetical protein
VVVGKTSAEVWDACGVMILNNAVMVIFGVGALLSVGAVLDPGQLQASVASIRLLKASKIESVLFFIMPPENPANFRLLSPSS